MIKITQAVIKDVAQLMSLEDDLFDSDQLSKRQFLYHIKSNKNKIYVAKELDLILGYILIFNNKNNKFSRIYSLAVKREYQSKGIGRLLLEYFLDHLPQSINTVSLEVYVENEKAIKLYKQYGFEIIKTIQSYYQNNTDAYLMHLNRKKVK